MKTKTMNEVFGKISFRQSKKLSYVQAKELLSKSRSVYVTGSQSMIAGLDTAFNGTKILVLYHAKDYEYLDYKTTTFYYNK